MTDIPIIKVDYGIASNYGDTIEINRKLDSYPHLKNKILAHEKRHVSGKYTMDDFKNDFQSQQSTFFEQIRFCITNKEALVNFFPFMYSYHFKEWSFNSSSIYPFAFLGIIYVMFFKLLVGLPILYSIFGWITAVLILNLIFIIITHTYVKTTQFTRKTNNFSQHHFASI